MDSKDILKKVKALFFGEPIVAPVAPAAAAAPVAPVAPAGQPFKLKDGTEVMIAVKDPAGSPAVGDAVTIAGAPAPDGEHELEDSSKITVTGGIISAVTPIQPVTQTPEEMAAAQAAHLALSAQATELTAESVAAMYAKFATGTPEERIANLEVMIKALMECNFGYQIRQGQETAAIQVYKESLTPVQTTMAAHTTKVAEFESQIKKQDEVIKGLFELCEKLIDAPTADPATLTGRNKEKFDAVDAKEKRLQARAAELTKLKNKNNNPANA